MLLSAAWPATLLLLLLAPASTALGLPSALQPAAGNPSNAAVDAPRHSSLGKRQQQQVAVVRGVNLGGWLVTESWCVPVSPSRGALLLLGPAEALEGRVAARASSRSSSPPPHPSHTSHSCLSTFRWTVSSYTGPFSGRRSSSEPAQSALLTRPPSHPLAALGNVRHRRSPSRPPHLTGSRPRSTPPRARPSLTSGTSARPSASAQRSPSSLPTGRPSLPPPPSPLLRPRPSADAEPPRRCAHSRPTPRTGLGRSTPGPTSRTSRPQG